MRLHRSLGILVALAIIAVPLHAGIKAMNLAQLMEITTDTIHAQVVERSVHSKTIDGEEVVYTKLTVIGESMRRNEPVSMNVVYMGSHDPADNFMMSEMPEAQDVRVGAEVVLFTDGNVEFFDGMPVVHNLANAFRVENAFGTKVVIGKGEGMAVSTNAKLSDMRTTVRDLHIQLEAAKATLEAEKAAANPSNDGK